MEYLNSLGFINYSPPADIYDGNTVGWYVYNDLSTLSLTSDSSVSRWNDKLGSGHDLIQNTSTKKPKWITDGILFDGVDNMLRTDSFTYIQPEKIYIVMKQITRLDYARIFTGNYNDDYNSGDLVIYGSSPVITLSSPNILGDLYNVDLQMNTWGIVRVLFNGTNSKLRVNNLTEMTGNPGTNNMNGFTLGGVGLSAGSHANIQVKEIILRKTADSTTTEQNIYNYLNKKYFISLTPPAILNDGNTVAWYDYNIPSTLSLTVDSSVSRWNDKLGSGRDLIQDISTAKPKWTNDGILFDGIDDALTTSSFTYNMPQQVYLVLNPLSWADSKRIMTGGSNSMLLVKSSQTSLGIYSGNFVQSVISYNTPMIVRALFNGAQSKLTVNNNTPTTGDTSYTSVSNISFGGNGALFGTSLIKEAIFRKVKDFPLHEQQIYDYLNNKYFGGTAPVLADGYIVKSSNSFVKFEYEPETISLLSRMSSQPSTSLKNLINHTISDLKRNNIWTKLDLLYFLNLHTEQASCLNWIKNSHDISTNGSPTWTAKLGFTGNGSNMYLDTNWSPSQGVNYTLNNACFGVHTPSAEMNGTQYEFHGCWSGSTANRIQLQFYNAYAAQTIGGVLNGQTSGATGWLNSTGLLTADRDGASSLNVYMNGNENSWQVGNVAAASLGVQNAYLLCLNNLGSPGYYSKDSIGLAYAGASMSSTMHRQLYNIMTFFNNRIGETF